MSNLFPAGLRRRRLPASSSEKAIHPRMELASFGCEFPPFDDSASVMASGAAVPSGEASWSALGALSASVWASK